MAISRDKKQSLVSELAELFGTAKMTAYARYDGLSVADLQTLRRAARENGVTIKVVKNRLVRVAMQQTDALKTTETGAMTGQLLYAISSEDEVAPAQVLATFAKTHEALQLTGAFSAEGKSLDAIVANDVSQPGIGFDSQRNAVTIISRDHVTEVLEADKCEVDHRVLDALVRIKAARTAFRDTIKPLSS